MVAKTDMSIRQFQACLFENKGQVNDPPYVLILLVQVDLALVELPSVIDHGLVGDILSLLVTCSEVPHVVIIESNSDFDYYNLGASNSCKSGHLDNTTNFTIDSRNKPKKWGECE